MGKKLKMYYRKFTKEIVVSTKEGVGYTRKPCGWDLLANYGK